MQKRLAKMFWSIHFILSFYLAYVSSLHLPKTYEVILIGFKSFPEDNQHVFDMTNFRVLGHEHAGNGTIVISEDLDDNYAGYAESFIDSFGNGQFKQLPLKIWHIPVCQGIKEFLKKYTYPSLIPGNNTDFPFDGSQCPVRKGTYYIKNMILDPTPFPNILPRGIFKAIFHFVKGNQKLGNVELVFQVKDRMF